MNGKKPSKAKGLIPGILAGGAAFGLFTLIVHAFGASLNAVSGILGGVLALGVGAVVKIMASGLDTTTHNRQDLEKAKDPLASDAPRTGDAAADALLSEGYTLLHSLRKEKDALPDGELKTNLSGLESACLALFQAVVERPARAGRIRKFVSYYLPTALKLVQSGSDMNRKGLADAASQPRIAESIAAVTEACRKLLEKLCQDQVIDMTAEMDVLEKMLRRDGLSSSELDEAERQAKEAAALDTRLMGLQSEKAEAAAPYQSGVEEQVQKVRENARNTVPSVPTMDGGTYCAVAEAPKEQQ